MLPAAQLAIQRRLTRAFIAQNPTLVTLIPREIETTNIGGRLKTAGVPRTPQLFSLLEPSDSGYRSPTNTADGSQVTFDFMLLGDADTVIGENDTFLYEGREYKIETIMHFNGYERRALVIRHGW